MNKLKRILCAILSVCMLSMPIALSSISASAESISSLEQQLQDLEEKNKEYQAILDETRADIEEKEEYSAALVKKVEVLDDKIALTRESIDELNASIDEKEADIEQANLDIEDQMDALCNRLRTIYMAGSASDLEIIFGAKDFSDFIDKMTLVNTLSNYDKDLIDGINEKLDEISEQKEALELDKAELEEKQLALENDQDELNALIEENDEILRGLYAVSDDAKEALEGAALQSDEIESQIAAYYESLNKQDPVDTPSNEENNNEGGSSSQPSKPSPTPSTPSVSPTPNASGFVWPVPGFYWLSSEWNEDRYTYNHGAIDIAGGGIMRATTVAAEEGTVIATYNSCPHNWGKSGSCGCGGGYGNYVMISHAGGKMTVYAHLTNCTVSTGQYVTKGQTIGYVGSTGYSTGPHLHFECRLNGVKYNPMLEYPYM